MSFFIVSETPIQHGWRGQLVLNVHRPPKRIPDESGLWPVLDKLSRNSKVLNVEFPKQMKKQMRAKFI